VPHPMTLACLILGIVTAAGGAWAWRRGRRRVGATAHCRRCDYVLITTDGRCPECGADSAAGGVVRGDRATHWPWVVAALLCLGLSLGLFTAGTAGLSRHLDWYHVRPAAWVLRDLRSDDPAVAQRAWDELRRRWDAARLSAAHREATLLACAGEQAVEPERPVAGQMIDFVAAEVAAGRAGPDVRRRFFDLAMRAVVTLRDPTGAGEPVPCRLTFRHRYGGERSPTKDGRQWWSAVDVGPITVDGKEVEGGGGGIGSNDFNSFGGRDRVVGPFPPGRHALRWAATWWVWYAAAAADPYATPELAKQAVVGTAEFVVQPAPTTVAHDASPATTAGVRAALGAREVGYSYWQAGRPPQLSGVLDVIAPPADVAARVFARVGGKEYELGTVEARRGANRYWYFVGPWDMPVAPKVDLVVRGSDDVARSSLDLRDTWVGEAVLADVPVKSPPATRPAGQTP
jgi:hypothetical protein